MVDPKLLSYVRKEISRGVSKDKLISVLIAQKWPKQEVEAALIEAEQKKVKTEEPKQAIKKVLEEVEKEKPKTKQQKCPKCGATYGVGDSFCPECGKQVQERSSSLWEFFKPTKGKLIAPAFFLIYLIFFFLMAFKLPIGSIRVTVFFLGPLLSAPFGVVLDSLGLWQSAGWADIGGPSLLGLILSLVIWMVIAFLISCIIAHIVSKFFKPCLKEFLQPTKWQLFATIVLFIIIGRIPVPVYNYPYNYLLPLLSPNSLLYVGLIVIILLPSQLLISYLATCFLSAIWKKGYYMHLRKAFLMARVIFLTFILIFAMLALIFKTEYKNWYYMNAAKAKLDISKCDMIDDSDNSIRMKRDCYMEIIYKKKSPSFCDSISDTYSKDRCYIELNKYEPAQSNCENLREGGDKILCFTEAAMIKKDVSFCDYITDIPGKARCYKKTATAAQNESICADIIDQEMICNEYGLCGGKTNERVECYQNVAIVKQDESVCENLEPYYMADCIVNIAILKKDMSICEKIPKVDNPYAKTKEYCRERVDSGSECIRCQAVYSDILPKNTRS